MQTTRPLTPIEIAMDKAMGFTGSRTAPVMVTLRCPSCDKTQQAKADETDPEGTAVIELHCPDCAPTDSKGAGVFYFDKDGKEIMPQEARSR